MNLAKRSHTSPGRHQCKSHARCFVRCCRIGPCKASRALRCPPVDHWTGGVHSFAPDSHEAWIDDCLPWRPKERRAKVMAPPNAKPLVLLPGFGNDTEDYMQPFGRVDVALVTLLRERGWHVSVVELRRRHWFNVGRALFTRGYFAGSHTTEPGYAWYLQRVRAAVNAAREATGSEQVTLIGHSAGGWLGRAFLGDPQYGAPKSGGPNPAVSGLVMLGTPQRPPPAGSGAHDMTGGALGWVNRQWPGAYFAAAGVHYACVAGGAVRGNPRPTSQQPLLPRYAHAAYSQVCGAGSGIVGDSVVPVHVALLEGGTNVVLDGVLHSMSRVGTFKAPAPKDAVWYGDGRALDHWLHLVAAMEQPPAVDRQAAALEHSSSALEHASGAVKHSSIVLPHSVALEHSSPAMEQPAGADSPAAAKEHRSSAVEHRSSAMQHAPAALQDSSCTTQHTAALQPHAPAQQHSLPPAHQQGEVLLEGRQLHNLAAQGNGIGNGINGTGKGVKSTAPALQQGVSAAGRAASGQHQSKPALEPHQMLDM